MRTLELSFCADCSAGQLNIYRLGNSRPSALSLFRYLARAQDVSGMAPAFRRTEQAAMLKIVAVVDRMWAEIVVDGLEAGTHDHEGGCDNRHVEFDNNHEVGRNDEPWELVSES